MPWQGGQVFVGDIVLEGDCVSVSNSVRIAGETGKVSAGYPTWANDNTLIFTSDPSGYSNPWKFEDGDASPIFSDPIKEDFAPPMWSLDMFPYSIVDSAGTQALWTAVKDGRDTFYIVDIDGKKSPQQIDTPFVAIRGLRSLSQANGQVVFCGQKVDESENIVQASMSDLQNGSFKLLKQPSATVKFSKELVSPPRPIALTIPDDGSPLYVVLYSPRNPSYSGSNIPGERPPCVVNIHGGPTDHVAQGLDWKKQYFTTRGWAWYVFDCLFIFECIYLTFVLGST
jgi:dipeptidyl aminopeptidase/acylaminoacyl peptidase